MKLYATVSMTIVFATLVWIVSLNMSHAGCIGAEVGEGCIGIPTPHEHPYRYDDHDRDHPPVIERRHQHRDHHHDDELED